MGKINLNSWLLGALAAILVTGVEAKVNSELRPLADDLNVLLASNVASSDLQIDFATNGYLAPSGLLLDPNPSARADVTINTQAIAAGEIPVATNSATVSITFDYARGTELSPSSDHNQRYALILWHGVEANDPILDTTNGSRATMITSGIEFDPTLSAAHAHPSANTLTTFAADAATPMPNSVVLMASAIAFVGFSRRPLSAPQRI